MEREKKQMFKLDKMKPENLIWKKTHERILQLPFVEKAHLDIHSFLIEHHTDGKKSHLSQIYKTMVGGQSNMLS